MFTKSDIMLTTAIPHIVPLWSLVFIKIVLLASPSYVAYFSIMTIPQKCTMTGVRITHIRLVCTALLYVRTYSSAVPMTGVPIPHTRLVCTALLYVCTYCSAVPMTEVRVVL